MLRMLSDSFYNIFLVSKARQINRAHETVVIITSPTVGNSFQSIIGASEVMNQKETKNETLPI